MKQIIFTLFLIFVSIFSAFAQADTCPKITVQGGGVVQPGWTMSFTVQMTGKSNDPNLEYEWKVSNGTIASGQRTTSITIDTTGLAGGTNIMAEVKIKGLPENCSNTASEVGATSPLCSLFNRLIDEFGNLPRNEVKARTEVFLVTLGNEPNKQGYIINYGGDREITAREKLIKDYLGYRKYDVNRITFGRGGKNPSAETGVWTKFWILPPGETLPSEQ